MTTRTRLALVVCVLLAALTVACGSLAGERNVERGGDVPPARTAQP